jgi:hypothetical protein
MCPHEHRPERTTRQPLLLRQPSVHGDEHLTRAFQPVEQRAVIQVLPAEGTDTEHL